MAVKHEALNELAAEKAVRVVRMSNPGQDPEAIANGGRVVSEVIHRTLAKLGLDLPEGYRERLDLEFRVAGLEEAATADRNRYLRQEMESSGP